MSSQPSTLRAPAPMDPRIKARRIEVRRGEGRRRLQRLVESGLVVLVAAGFVVALRSPLLDVDAVEVSGAARTSSEVVRDRVGISAGDALIDVDLEAAGERVAALPWVDEVRLDRHLDGTVRVVITERQPVALAGASGAQVLVDGEGRVLGPAEDLAGSPPLVRLAGVDEPPPPGTHLDLDADGALALAELLASEVPGAVAELATVDGELVGALARGGSVRFGEARRLDAKVRSLATVLAQVDLTCLGLIDLRLPGSPVLTREESCS